MAVPLQFISVIVRCSTLEEKYPGGLEAYADASGSTFASDGRITRVGFMGPGDVEWFVSSLEAMGLRLLDDEGFRDIAVVDALWGPTRQCRWLDVAKGRCWLRGTDPGETVETRGAIDARLAPGPVGRSALGVALGDCLGAGVEGRSADDIRAAYASTYGFVRSFRFDPMVWTDDTQQALTLVEATKRFGYPDPQWVAQRWLEMSRLGLHRGTGRGFRASIEEFGRTGDPSSSGRTDRAGNGAAMRIGPAAVALRALEDDEFTDRLVSVSLITHREIRALSGMLAVAFVSRALANTTRYPPRREMAREVLSQLVYRLRQQEIRLVRHPAGIAGADRAHEVSDALRGVEDRWSDGWETICAWIEENATSCRGVQTRIGEGFVTASVVGAVAWTLSSISMLPETLVGAVSFGDDTDTFAAMVGGMAGAGTPGVSIPDRWKSFAGRDELVAWGRAIDKDESIDGLPDVIELETRLTRLVRS